MGELFKNAPAIIGAAAASGLGIIALMVLASATLIYLLFRRVDVRWRFAALSLFLMGCAGFGVAAFQNAPAMRDLGSSTGGGTLPTAIERWNAEAEKARAARTLTPGRPLPTELSSARSAFETAWREAPLPAKRALDPKTAATALSYLNRLYRLQEIDSPTQPNAIAWADEAVRFFEETQHAALLTSALLDKAAIYLDLAQLQHDDRQNFEKIARDGDAVMTRALQTSSPGSRPEVLRIASRFYYNLARPQSFRLGDAWDNNYLLLAYAKAEEAYKLAPSDRKNTNQLARTTIKVSKNPPQDRDPSWALRLREAKNAMKSAWENDKGTLTALDERLSPLNVLGVVTLETVARQWRDATPEQRSTQTQRYIEEVDTDALGMLREATALLQNSQLQKAYNFDFHYDIARAWAVRTALVRSATPETASSNFEEVRKNLAAAKEYARTPQLESAMASVDREISFTLLTDEERRQLTNVLAIARPQ